MHISNEKYKSISAIKITTTYTVGKTQASIITGMQEKKQVPFW
jgi:hypothetical protein